MSTCHGLGIGNTQLPETWVVFRMETWSGMRHTASVSTAESSRQASWESDSMVAGAPSARLVGAFCYVPGAEERRKAQEVQPGATWSVA